MTYRTLATAVVVSGLFAAGCDDTTPTEVTPTLLGPQHAVTVNEKDVPFAQWLTVPVCGDFVYIEGTDHWVEKFTETPDGRTLISWRTNYKGTATGYPSGNTWKLRGQWGNQVTIDSDGFPAVRTYVDDVRLIGQGQVPNVSFKTHYHVTINAHGDMVVQRLFQDIKCQAD